MVKRVQIPRGGASQEDGITGLEGQLRADMERGEIRLHDGAKQGGHRIPNLERVKELIARSADESNAGGVLQVFSSASAMADAAPNPQSLAVVTEEGKEDIFIWRPGAAGPGSIPSTVDGYWQRVNSQTHLAIRLWSTGLFDMQIGGVEPITNQDTTAWLDGEIFRTWDGADYVATTPVTFARLLAQIGGYSTSSFVLPDSLAETLVEVADLNDVDLDSGWYKSTVDATNAPVAGVHPFEHRRLSGTVAIQAYSVLDSLTLARYVRYKAAGTWGSWVLALDSIPARLASTANVVTDADNATDSGFYQAASTATHIPRAENGTILSTRYSSTSGTQLWQGLTTGKAYIRSRLASTWGAWKKLSYGDGVGRVEMVLIDEELDGTFRLNGAEISRTDYWELFAAWGTTYGAGDGSTTFKILDVRGEFPRFWSDGSSVDSGRTLGSAQSEMIGPHPHTATFTGTPLGNHQHSAFRERRHGLNGSGGTGWSDGDTLNGNDNAFMVGAASAGTPAGSVTVDDNAGTENRPRNIAFLGLVRYE